jgi:hypothetical protein
MHHVFGMTRTKSNKPERALLYGPVEKALAHICWIDEHQKGAFRGKLKHLQRIGLPEIEPGKGRRVAYTRELVFQWLIALLLGQLGIDPVLVVRTVKENWKNVLAPAIEAAISRRARAGNHVYLVLRPRLMSGGGLQISWFERHSPIGGGIDNLPDAADKEFPGMQTWFCAIDLTPFASNLDMLFS